MFRKAKSVTEDSRVQPLQRSAVTQPAAAMLYPSETISSIGPGDSTEEEPTLLRHTGMHAFLPACIAIISIGVVSYFVLNTLQQPRYTIDNVRIDPGSIERSTQLGSTEPLSGLESAAVRAPETPQAAPVVQNAPETIAPKARDASLDPEQSTAVRASTPEMPQAAAVAQNAPETIAPKARDASLDPEQSTAVRASTPETPQAAPVVQNAPETIAPKARGASLDAKMAAEDAKLQAIDVEVLANVPLPRPRPTAAPARKFMSVLQRSARAPTAPPWLRALISPN